MAGPFPPDVPAPFSFSSFDKRHELLFRVVVIKIAPDAGDDVGDGSAHGTDHTHGVCEHRGVSRVQHDYSGRDGNCRGKPERVGKGLGGLVGVPVFGLLLVTVHGFGVGVSRLWIWC